MGKFEGIITGSSGNLPSLYRVYSINSIYVVNSIDWLSVYTTHTRIFLSVLTSSSRAAIIFMNEF